MDLLGWLSFKRNKTQNNTQPTARTAIAWMRDGVAIAHSKKTTLDQWVLQFCEFYPFDEMVEGNRSLWLIQFTKERGLAFGEFHWILLPDEYQLLVLDKPKAGGNTDKEALLWTAKEYIDFPLADVVMDVCDIPEFGLAKQHKMYVVIGRRTRLSPTLKLLRDSWENPSVIGVTAFALRNIANVFSTSNSSVALVSLTNYFCIITLSMNGYLYFTRKLQLDVALLDDSLSQENDPSYTNEATEVFKTLVSHVESSLEYFETQMGQTRPASIIFTPLPFRSTQLKAYLNDHISTPIIFADLNQVIKSEQELTLETQSHCLPVLGALLSQKDVNCESRN